MDSLTYFRYFWDHAQEIFLWHLQRELRVIGLHEDVHVVDIYSYISRIPLRTTVVKTALLLNIPWLLSIC